MNGTCKDCKWWTHWKIHAGFCHGGPPIKSADQIGVKTWTSAQWPLTACDDFCGAFRPFGKVIEESEYPPGTIQQTIQGRDGREFIYERELR